MKCNRSYYLYFSSDHFVKTVSKNDTCTMLSCNGSRFMKMMTSQVIQVTWLTGKLISPNNLHVSRNLSILIVVLVELEQKRN